MEPLDAAEVGVLGPLLEREPATPEYYPLETAPEAAKGIPASVSGAAMRCPSTAAAGEEAQPGET